MSETAYVEMSVTVIRETEKALLVNDGTVEAWIPKSQLEYDPEYETNEQGEEFAVISIPEWLAEDKEFF